MSARPRGRFAPSPTGLLHLGNIRSALLGWLQMRAVGGEFLLRIEDLDPERSKPEMVDAIFRDLEFLGLDWDREVLVQSQRRTLYDQAIERLLARDQAFRCWCSRADIARVASAPHVGEDGPVYPGTCAHGATPHPTRPPSIRFRTSHDETSFIDLLHGETRQDVAAQVGDFVLRRWDGVASYQIAVVLDDAASGITDVLRADDLLWSTPRQLQLMHALSLPIPRYAHVPLLLQEDGKRLAKRHGATTIHGLRERGVSAQAIVGMLARWSGLSSTGEPTTPQELVKGFALEKISREPTIVREAELEALS